jgi:hypothetical protein
MHGKYHARANQPLTSGNGLKKMQKTHSIRVEEIIFSFYLGPRAFGRSFGLLGECETFSSITNFDVVGY